MIHLDPDQQRLLAGKLANLLGPLLADLPAARPVAAVKRVYVHADRDLLKAAERVASAVDRLVQAKFTPQEIPARLALERAANSLRTEIRRRPAKSPSLKQDTTK